MVVKETQWEYKSIGIGIAEDFCIDGNELPDSSSWQDQKRSDSQEGLCSMDLVVQ